VGKSNPKSLCLQEVKTKKSMSDKIQDIVVDLLLPPQDVGVNWFVTSFVGALSVWVSQ
jgi:hypothetical protein